jgi:UDP-glucose 4-epimerase
MLKSENLGDHFRIKVDSRDLNYDKYFSKGDSKVDEQKEYNSSNTELLNKEKLIKILLKLPEVISELK